MQLLRQMKVTSEKGRQNHPISGLTAFCLFLPQPGWQFGLEVFGFARREEKAGSFNVPRDFVCSLFLKGAANTTWGRV